MTRELRRKSEKKLQIEFLEAIIGPTQRRGEEDNK